MAAVAAPLALAALVGCRTPTELRLSVRNDAPCVGERAGARVRIYTARDLAGLASAAAESSAASCGGASDDVVIVPRDGASAFAVKIATRLDGGEVDACFAAPAARGCIVQRWTFEVPKHASRTFATALTVACADVLCPDATTCVGDGVCAPSAATAETPILDDARPPPDARADAVADSAPADVLDADARDADAPDTARPPFTVRLVDNVSTGVGHLDACVVRADGSFSPPLISDVARGIVPLHEYEISGELALPDVETITLALTTGDVTDCSASAPKLRVSATRPASGKLIAIRDGAFDAKLIADPAVTVGDGVTVHGVHADNFLRTTPFEFGASVSGATDFPVAAVGFGQASDGFREPGKVSVTFARSTGVTLDSGPIGTELGRAYTMFVLGQVEGPSVVVVCQDGTIDVDRRAVCQRKLP